MIGICGASGFIGQEIFRQLMNKGETVLGTYCNNRKIGLVRFDLRRHSFKIFDDCSYVVVASAYAKIKFCQENNLEAFFLNVYRTKLLLDYLNEKGIPTLFISSDAAVKVDLMDTNYGKYKRMIEKHIKKKKLKSDFIRPGKIDKDNIKDLCKLICEQAWAYKGRKD
ncbi:unnamed protein product [marine sediment metagenome]|uniref:NAD-dependent epimerase/dehydratase domain-containing protein n=1 Tax=marine sediment metagenome TaxID=412755 RepID=X0UXB5_9ZZZZ